MRLGPSIIVTGIPRSGIGMIGGVLHVCGAWGGNIGRANFYYGHDSFENKAIRSVLVDPFLRKAGAYPPGQAPLPDIAHCHEMSARQVKKWAGIVHGLLYQCGYREGPAFYLSPIACLLWPIWARAFPDATWIIVRRPDEDIIDSCMKTGYMTAHRDPAGWQRWVNVHKLRFQELIDMDFPVRQIWVKHVLGGDTTEMRKTIEFCGLKWQAAAVEGFLGPIFAKAGKSRRKK